MVDLHRHDEASTFDGFGKARELAELAKELGHTSLGTSNHGSLSGNIKTYVACKEVGIKPILGVECYMLPKMKEQDRGYHLCLFVKNLQGYENLNRIMHEAEYQKYYHGLVTFDILEKYSEGIICTSACVAGYLSQCIVNNKMKQAKAFIKKMVNLFGDDFYIEIQPYVVSEEGLQEKINIGLMKLAKEMHVKTIMTSDSHRGRKEDLETYVKMHQIAGHDEDWVRGTYAERYMPTEKELKNRMLRMHKVDLQKMGFNPKAYINEMMDNLQEIEDKVEEGYLEELPLELPKLSEEKDKSFHTLVQKVKQGLKDRGKYKKNYIERCKEELDVIKYHGFEDYFLIVADYVNWGKSQGIPIGPGRGSVCNSVVAYALKITEVDSILLGLDFRRFLRKDKKKYPDIDLDFATNRRQEVIEYLIDKYKGHAARICSYGLYKVDNLVNDLAKVCGLEIDKDTDVEEKKYKKEEIAGIKSLINSYMEDEKIDVEGLLNSNEGIDYNNKYDDILVHFCKMYKKMRYIGTHAAGVAITGGDILNYASLRVDKDGNLFTVYDLSDLEEVHIIKFDILGLKTMESIGELRKSTGVQVDYDEIIEDKNILQEFHDGNCDGIFQFEKKTARDILKKIDTDCFEDIVAASSMNRPGPLSLKMPEVYAENKFNREEAATEKHYAYTESTYGTIIYQEQIQQIVINIGEMTWADADKIMKYVKGGAMTEENRIKADREKAEMVKRFADGAIHHGYTREEAEALFEKFLVYSFNKGHGAGYGLISVEEMYYKVYHPTEYWYSKVKYARNDSEVNRFCEKAVIDDVAVFLPHVNYAKPKTSMRKFEGERVIQQGLSTIKDVGEKAAEFIYEERRKNGVFVDFDDFYDRCKSRTVTSRVIDKLKEAGALEFNKKIYVSRVTKYNSALYQRGQAYK